MKTRIIVVVAAAALAACSKEAPTVAPAAPPPAAVAAPAPPPPPEPVAAQVPPAEPAAAPVRRPPEPAKAPPAAKAAPAPKGPEAAPKPAPAAADPTLASTHGKVGDAKCRMCHKLQHDSWSASPHAAKHLDCEGCHGGGADFMKVMRDRTAAIAAGLVLPKPEFCRRCHKADWQDGMYLRVHAHKAK